MVFLRTRKKFQEFERVVQELKDLECFLLEGLLHSLGLLPVVVLLIVVGNSRSGHIVAVEGKDTKEESS
jgi:ABC-type uncharacterized transport system involved in gliding motility auxiliary subunit